MTRVLSGALRRAATQGDQQAEQAERQAKAATEARRLGRGMGDILRTADAAGRAAGALAIEDDSAGVVRIQIGLEAARGEGRVQTPVEIGAAVAVASTAVRTAAGQHADQTLVLVPQP